MRAHEGKFNNIQAEAEDEDEEDEARRPMRESDLGK